MTEITPFIFGQPLSDFVPIARKLA
jgi:hypothetical protein